MASMSFVDDLKRVSLFEHLYTISGTYWRASLFELPSNPKSLRFNVLGAASIADCHVLFDRVKHECLARRECVIKGSFCATQHSLTNAKPKWKSNVFGN
jgi:hypothetical protein